MRLRKKRWARPELEESNLFITDAFEHSGKWNEVFGNNNPIYLELGCGRGKFLSTSAQLNPKINYIGIDLKDEVMIYTLRKLKDAEIENGRIIPMNIMRMDGVFGPSEIDRIYINFCNPWPKLRHNKRRLTHTGFLNMYKKFLKPESEIWFKTDDRGLFEDSRVYFDECGFEIIYETYDLANSDFEQNITTEYEAKFTALGMKTMFLIAKLRK